MSKQDLPEPGPAETIARFEGKGDELITSRGLFEYADALRKVGRRQQALLKYEELEALPVTASKAWLVSVYKGQTLFEMGKFSEAEQCFRKACIQDATTVPRVYLAGALAAQERFEDAMVVLLEALSHEGDRDEVWLNMALNQRTLGDLQSAEQSLVEALTITPEYPSALACLFDIRNALSIKPAPDSARSTPRD